MALREELHRRRETVLAIAGRHGVTNVCLFGSVVRGEERPDSDIDLIIDLDEGRGFDDYLSFADELEQLFGRRVEVVLRRSLSRHFRPFVEKEAEAL